MGGEEQDRRRCVTASSFGFISVGPQAPYFQFVESIRIWSNVSRARGQICDWISRLRAQALRVAEPAMAMGHF